MARGRRTSRRRLDWVLNDDSWEQNNVLVPAAGTHSVSLVYSAHQQVLATVGLGVQDAGAIPEGRAQVVRAVRGLYHVQVSTATWIAGTSIDVLTRIVDKPQDLLTGAAIVDPVYSIAQAPFANERFLSTDEHRAQFVAGTAMGIFKQRVNVKTRRVLDPSHGLFLLVENNSNVDIIWNCKLRTLVEV